MNQIGIPLLNSKASTTFCDGTGLLVLIYVVGKMGQARFIDPDFPAE